MWWPLEHYIAGAAAYPCVHSQGTTVVIEGGKSAHCVTGRPNGIPHVDDGVPIAVRVHASHMDEVA